MSENNLHTSDKPQSKLFNWGATSHVGNIRFSNQDKYGATPALVAVADGMGGHSGGEIAAEIAIGIITSANDFESIIELAQLVQKANESIQARAEENINLAGMGTTLCALSEICITNTSARIGAVNVGDSRIYIFADNQLHQVSIDHSVVQNLIDSGQINEIEAKSHPNRNLITRCLGTKGTVEVDAWEIEAFIGDRYLLCTDGLTNELSDTEIARILQEQTDPQLATDKLIQTALVNGGSDNVTAVVLDILLGEKQTKQRSFQFELQTISDQISSQPIKRSYSNKLKKMLNKMKMSKVSEP